MGGTAWIIGSLILALAVDRWSKFRHRPKGASGVEDRRRSQRSDVGAPVLVYGWNSGAEPFSEPSEILNASALGALIQITTKLHRSQEILLTDVTTNEDIR